MVKLIAFFKRKEGLAVQDFQEHWRRGHAELVIRQAGLRRYVQNHTLESAYQSREPVYDGVAEAWFDDTESMRALAGSAEYRAVREDESRFIDPDSMGVLITDEVVVVDGPESEIKMITFLNKRTSQQSFFSIIGVKITDPWRRGFRAFSATYSAMLGRASTPPEGVRSSTGFRSRGSKTCRASEIQDRVQPTARRGPTKRILWFLADCPS